MSKYDWSLEQQFSLATFAENAKKMSREQAIDLLIDMHRQQLARESVYRHLLKVKWGLEDDLTVLGDK